MQEKIQFVRSEFVALLRNQLARDPLPAGLWGKMNFQQMVEHLVIAVKSANGKIESKVLTPEEHLPKWQAFLRDETKQFRENTKSPSFPDEPLPLHFASPELAVNKLAQEVEEFFAVYERTPDLRLPNPVFGQLDFELAVLLLFKHFQHHARQFGLLERIAAS